MKEPKKVYLSAMDTGRLGKPYSHMASNVYHSDTAIKEWIEENKVKNTLYSDQPYEIDLDELLKYLNQ